MRCWKCGKELQDGVTTCSHCRASQNRTQPVSAASKALREIYDRFGSEAVFTNEIYFTNVLADLLQDSKKLRNLLKWSLDAGMGKIYLQQLERQGSADEDFHKRVKRILVEDACIAEAMSEEIMQYMDEMIGWPVKDADKTTPTVEKKATVSEAYAAGSSAKKAEQTTAASVASTKGYDPWQKQTKPLGSGVSGSQPKKSTPARSSAKPEEKKAIAGYVDYLKRLENRIEINGYNVLTAGQINDFMAAYRLHEDWGIEFNDVRIDMNNILAKHRKSASGSVKTAATTTTAKTTPNTYPAGVMNQSGKTYRDPAYLPKNDASMNYNSEILGYIIVMAAFLAVGIFFCSVGGIWIGVIAFIFCLVGGIGNVLDLKKNKGKFTVEKLNAGIRCNWPGIEVDQWAIAVDGSWVVSGKDKTVTSCVLPVDHAKRIVFAKMNDKQKAQFVAETNVNF